MSIERSTWTGYIVYQVWQDDTLLASFDSYCDAVDFVRFFMEM